MKRHTIDLGRRQVLRGAGGVVVGLPILPSLLTPAFGADPTYIRRPRFFAMSTNHGGITGDNMYPGAATLTNKRTLFAGHEAKWGMLARTVAGNNASLSKVLTGSSSVLTERLVSKMNVLRGLDVPFLIGHNTGLHLGNYARNDGNGGEGPTAQKFPMPTIDNVMGWSPSFYPDIGNIRRRVHYAGSQQDLSYSFSNPSAKSGSIVSVGLVGSLTEQFDALFPQPTGPSVPPPAQRPPLVDKVLASYKRLRNGNTRLSALDKQRLDDHIGRLAELQRKVTIAAPLSCKAGTKPTNSTGNSVADQMKYHQLTSELIATAFMCGVTRIAVVGVGYPLAATSLDWHTDVAHMDRVADRQALLVTGLQNSFTSTFLELASRLDVDEVPGITYLDNALLAWSQECGAETHDSNGIPVVTAGGAAGFLKTGLYCDYRNTSSNKFIVDGSDYTGLLYNRWLGTVLQAMGLSRPEYESPMIGGYGWYTMGAAFTGKYVAGAVESSGDVLPFIKA